MKLLLASVSVIPLLLCLFSCGDDSSSGTNKSKGDDTQQASKKETMPTDHGSSLDLGTVTVAGTDFSIVQLGDLVPGAEGAFEVGAEEAELASLNVYLWVESEDGTQLSSPAKGSPEGDVLHFHVTPRKGDKTPHRVVLRLRSEGVDERAGLPLDGHGHEHRDGPHHGIPATFTGGDVSGHLELKLHDDKGDLELWLTEDPEFSRPFDLPIDASIELEFIDVEGRKAKLRPRNTDKNEDEDGNPNIRDGKTNYFIFPSQDGEDASWLQGKDFSSIVVARFVRDGQSFESEEFVLKPHVH